jgi:hypothetical protein
MRNIEIGLGDQKGRSDGTRGSAFFVGAEWEENASRDVDQI